MNLGDAISSWRFGDDSATRFEDLLTGERFAPECIVEVPSYDIRTFVAFKA
jgi:hypothetical protein